MGPVCIYAFWIYFKEHQLGIKFLLFNHTIKIIRAHDSNTNNGRVIGMFYTSFPLLLSYAALQIIRVQQQITFVCIIGIWHFLLLQVTWLKETMVLLRYLFLFLHFLFQLSSF